MSDDVPSDQVPPGPRTICRGCSTRSYEPGYGCHLCDTDVHNFEESATVKRDRFDGTDGNGYQPKRDADRIAGSNPPPSQDRPEPPPAPPIAELKFERSNFLAAAAFLDRNMEGLIAYQRVISRLSRERYVALLTVGFSEAQALELIKSPLF